MINASGSFDLRYSSADYTTNGNLFGFVKIVKNNNSVYKINNYESETTRLGINFVEPNITNINYS